MKRTPIPREVEKVSETAGLSHPLWVVVADGATARFFVRKLPELPLEEVGELAESAARVERHHGGHDDVGHGQHAVLARTTPHERREQHFLRHVAGQIDRATIEHAIGALVLCAPPRALGLFRSFISENARQLVVREIPHDIVRESVDQIGERLKESGI
ncbi:MAG TPA: host attachment protein [Hyphomonadaceae bacterium]|nr:host attachment protein [Hyphomonadaceae bacterium]